MIKVAVIGAGMMGRNHARVYADLNNVELTGVADIDLRAAQTTARRYNAAAYAHYLRLLDNLKPDAVTIAVPTERHLEVALSVIERGIHLLLEKPIARSVDEAEQIIAAAQKANVRLMVGHIERFNPAVMALKQRLTDGELGRVFEIDARRQSPFPTRVQDVGVVVDLAVHDLDIMRYISQSEITRVFAETARRIHPSHEDMLSGLLRLDNGVVGSLTINWLTPTKIRELYVTGEKGMYRVDYLTQDLYFFENAIAQKDAWDTLTIMRGVTMGQMIRYVIPKKEPLRAELEAFIAAVKGEIPVPVTGQDGLKALSLALAVVQSGQENRPVALAS